MKIPLIFFIMFVFSIVAHGKNVPSGHEVGNGGSFVVCGLESMTGPGVFSLDRHEGELQHSLPPASFLSNFSEATQIVDMILDNLGRYDAVRGHLYKSWFSQMLASREFLDNLTLSAVQDSGVVTVVEGCQVHQAAVFLLNKELGSVRFIYDQKLWSAASALDQAYLMLHEIIYLEAKAIQSPAHINSMGARFMTAYLMANGGLQTSSELEQTFSRAGFNKL